MLSHLFHRDNDSYQGATRPVAPLASHERPIQRASVPQVGHERPIGQLGSRISENSVTRAQLQPVKREMGHVRPPGVRPQIRPQGSQQQVRPQVSVGQVKVREIDHKQVQRYVPEMKHENPIQKHVPAITGSKTRATGKASAKGGKAKFCKCFVGGHVHGKDSKSLTQICGSRVPGYTVPNRPETCLRMTKTTFKALNLKNLELLAIKLHIKYDDEMTKTELQNLVAPQLPDQYKSRTFTWAGVKSRKG